MPETVRRHRCSTLTPRPSHLQSEVQKQKTAARRRSRSVHFVDLPFGAWSLGFGIMSDGPARRTEMTKGGGMLEGGEAVNRCILWLSLGDMSTGLAMRSTSTHGQCSYRYSSLLWHLIRMNDGRLPLPVSVRGATAARSQIPPQRAV